MSFEHAKEAARQAYDQAKEQAAGYYSKGREKAKELQENSEHYIQEHPLKSVLIAAGAGLVLGMMLRRL
jgi:ElaB/YqjD/DUF883 family membrane-anchored ribosome-binding protein